MSFVKAPPSVCGVTGGTGLVGRRLVEMLAERGAKTVVSLDIAPKPSDAETVIGKCKIEYVQADITDYKQVLDAFKVSRKNVEREKSRERILDPQTLFSSSSSSSSE